MDYQTIVSKFDNAKKPSLTIQTILTKLKKDGMTTTLKQLKEFIVSNQQLSVLLDGETLKNPNYSEDQKQEANPTDQSLEEIKQKEPAKKQPKAKATKQKPEEESKEGPQSLDEPQPKIKAPAKPKKEKVQKQDEDGNVVKAPKTATKTKKSNEIVEIKLVPNDGNQVDQLPLIPFQKTSSKQTEFMLEIKKQYQFCNKPDFENVLPKLISFVDSYLKGCVTKFDSGKLKLHLDFAGVSDPCECDAINIIFAAIRYIHIYKTEEDYIINQFLETVARIALQFCNSISDEINIADFKKKFYDSKNKIHGLQYDDLIPLEYRNKSEIYHMSTSE